MIAIGELQESKQFEVKEFSWKIPNISYVSSGVSYRSPTFTFKKSSFHLNLHTPGGLSGNKYCMYVACDEQMLCPIAVSLSLKRPDGKLISSCTETVPFNRIYFTVIDVRRCLTTLSAGLPSHTLSIICSLKFSLDEGRQIPSAQTASNLNESSAIKTLKHMTLTETDVLSQNFKDLFLNGECCDAVLQVQDKEFKAHRAVLIARSSVFAAMFRHDTSEKETGIINVPDFDPDTLQQFLEYLYSGKLEGISFESADHLYSVSDKYNVKELKTFCTMYMVQNLTVENVFEAVMLADKYDDNDFLTAAQNFFNENFKQIVKTREWKNLLKINYHLANTLLIEMADSKH